MSTKSDNPEPAESNAATAIAPAAEDDAVEAKLEEFIEAIPEHQRGEARSFFQKEFFGLIERSGLSGINPEVAKLLVDSQDKDNEHKFQYLTQKQKDEAEAEKRQDEFKTQKHRDHFSLIKPVVFIVLFVIVASTAVGIYFFAIGKEAIGAALLSGIWGAVFGYLAGFGTSNFFKNN